MWRKWTETKHLFRNIYAPNFVKESGQTDDDAILNCCKHHWVYKKNKNIKAQNNKVSKQQKESKDSKKKPVTLLEAPDNLNQPAELFPEAVAYLIFKDHPMFIREAQINNQLTSTSTRNSESPNDANSEFSHPASDDVEDTTLRHQMTAKGFFKSRNTLRADERERKKNKKVSNSSTADVIDLTSTATRNDLRRTEAATQHAKAATLQAISGMFNTQLDALQRAQNMGVGQEDLRPFILHVIRSQTYTVQAMQP